MTRAGYFGFFGGQFVPETLMPALTTLQKAYEGARKNLSFGEELRGLLKNYAGRPSPLYEASRLTAHWGGARVFFKRDELNHTGSHKINNCLGQALLARHMGKKRLIAETGAGQHGVATATVAALFDLPCVVYMGAEDMARQKPNVVRMRLLGAEVRPVEVGAKTLKEAMNAALRDWVSHIEETFYIIGSVAGPHPYPQMVRDFQSVIGRETKKQLYALTGREPDTLVACVGGGSNAMGLFFPFLQNPCVRLVGVEAGGASGVHAAALSCGRPGILHGSRSYFLQDSDGQILPSRSIAAGLDYPGVGPEHAFLKESGRVSYVMIEDSKALAAFDLCARFEGILPALEPAHALGYVAEIAPTLPSDHIVVMNLCGRGDKDVETVARAKNWHD